MKVLIVSDTHGQEQNLAEALEKTGPIDQLIHLGDVEGGAEHIRELAGDAPAAIIAGNNDFFCDLPNERIFTLGGHRIFMTHGHTYYVNYGYEDLRAEAKSRGCDYAFFGHIHRPVLDDTEEVTVVNPGSISFPRQDNRRPSYAILDVNRKGDFDIEIYYL